ncbi:MAG: Lrp/AsnC family transcriptional regulator [Myxococcota bacterium]|nr:Lrp/AsnC family transcriptional regulator [Myxococcota bacterium]
MDSQDAMILQVLQEEGRLSNVHLAERVHLSESACLRRVRALEEDGTIRGYSARVDPRKAGVPGIVFVSITLERQDQEELHRFEEAVANVPEVMDCYLMTGEFDYLVRVVVADAEDFERIHRQALTRLPGVARIHSSFALRTVKRSSSLPIRTADA